MRRRVQQHTKRLPAQPPSRRGAARERFQASELLGGVPEDGLTIARGRGACDEEEAQPRHPSAFSRRSTPAAMPANAS